MVGKHAVVHEIKIKGAARPALGQKFAHSLSMLIGQILWTVQACQSPRGLPRLRPRGMIKRNNHYLRFKRTTHSTYCCGLGSNIIDIAAALSGCLLTLKERHACHHKGWAKARLGSNVGAIEWTYLDVHPRHVARSCLQWGAFESLGAGDLFAPFVRRPLCLCGGRVKAVR